MVWPRFELGIFPKSAGRHNRARPPDLIIFIIDKLKKPFNYTKSSLSKNLSLYKIVSKFIKSKIS